MTDEEFTARSSMDAVTAKARITSIVPFFIVRELMPSIAFYRDQLGFELEYIGPR